MSKILKKSLLVIPVLLISNLANAAAFQLSETSVAGLGRAFAGEAAIADNASVVATNPALMTKFNRPIISAGGVIFIPNVNVRGIIPQLNKEASENNIAPVKVVPQLYAVYPINDQFAIGGGVNVNYGLSTEFSNGFPGGFLGGESHVEAINFNLSGAYRWHNLSVGLGGNVIYAKAKITRYNGALPEVIVEHLMGKLPNSLKKPIKDALSQQYPANNLLVKLKGDDIGFGFNAGIAYDFDANNRIGLAYHSPIHITFKGDYTNDLYSPKLFGKPINLPPSITDMLMNKGVVFTNGQSIGVKVKTVLPEYVEFGGSHNLTDRLNLSYGVKWTHWSRFKEINAVRLNDGKTLFLKKENFKDSWRYAIGASYIINEMFTVRTGVAYDTSAADELKSISIPDTDRTWLTVGGTYNFNQNLSFDAGVAYIWGKKSQFIEDKGENTEASFEVKASAVLVGLNMNYRF